MLSIGRVRGHRGASGELTVVVADGDASHWTGLSRLTLEGPGAPRTHEIEDARAYADRLVVKLQGIDDAGQAAALRGARVTVPAAEAPPLSEGDYYAASLVGMTVEDASGTTLGRVTDVVPTGGADLLAVEAPGGDELLIPLARGIVDSIDVAAGRIRVTPPEGLLDVNRTAGRPA